MKTFFYLIVSLAISVIMVSCFPYRELPVEYDYSYKGRFDQYSSYDFLDQLDNSEISSTNYDVIYNTIESHMEFLGYKRQPFNPDLLLSFQLYSDSLNFTGYHQPPIQEFMTSKNLNTEDPTHKRNYKRMKINMKQGTLLIQIYDTEQKSSVWQGYATDFYGPVDFEDYQSVTLAVKSILNKYEFFAEEFMNEQKMLLAR